MTLENQIKEIETKMPGLKKEIKPYNFGFYDIYVKYSPVDIKYIETDKFKIAAVKWHGDSWSDSGGGTEWREKIIVYYKTPGDDQIYTKKTEEIVTRDMHNPKKDKEWLWRYKFVDLEKVADNIVEVSFMDNKGNKQNPKRVYLDMKKD